MDGTPIDALRAAGADGFVVAATGAGNTAAPLLAAAERAMADGLPVALTTRSPSGAASADYAFPGGGATWVRAGAMLAGHLGGPKARVALALGPRRAGWIGPASPRCWPIPRPRPWHARPMPLEALVTGRIATLAGDAGLRLGRGGRDQPRSRRIRRLRGRARDARRPVHRPVRARPRRGRDPGPDRRPSPPRRGRHRPRQGRPVAGPVARGGPRRDPGGGRGPARRRALDRGPRLGPGPVRAAGRPPTTSRRSCPGGTSRSGPTTTTRSG